LAEEISTYQKLVIQALALAVDLAVVAVAVVSVAVTAVDLAAVAVDALRATDLLVVMKTSKSLYLLLQS
jgi:hypothetical protein